jgi:non-heme chloroperoxidase
MGAIMKKDATSLWPLLLLTGLFFLADVILVRLDLLPAWTLYRTPVLLVAMTALTLPLFQLDSPVSLTDDWLCRPVPRRELIAAKLLLLAAVIYLPRVIGVLLADLGLGFPPREALLDAFLLQEGWFLFLLPGLVFIASVTRTFVQGFGVLFGLFICVFVIPTPFVRPPGPLEPGIRDALFFSGLQWLATTPAKLAAFVLVAVGIWLIYWRRRLVAARVLLGITVCVMLILLLLPMALMPWSATFAAHQAFAASPDPAAGAQTIHLRNPRTCFPAARRAELGTDADFVAATRALGLTLWTDEELPGVGPDAVAFLTAIEARGLPRDWRVKLNYVQAHYSAGGQRLYSLRPARYITDHAEVARLAHAWMVPEHALSRLQELQPRLDLDYSLTLLKPRQYSLPTDGVRRLLRGLGSCGAALDEPGNRILVSCFSALSHPAQISAELNDVPASRSFGSGRVDFAPGWAKVLYANSVELEIASLRLARHETVTVTAWEAAGHIEESLVLPGILGADLATCPTPSTTGQFRRASWRDSAPHESNSVGVDRGVQLEVLDFGGDGVPLLLLPGLGATAHSFDELGPLLARNHQVIAMTRRGSGYSSRPDFGFDTPRLAQDVLEVMNALNLGKVVLVGHSIAGEELTWLGVHHPDRIAGLVYLDAAYDRSRDSANESSRLRELTRRLPPEPPMPPGALLNYEAMSRFLASRGHVRYPEGELIAFFGVTNPHLAGTPGVDARTQQAILAAIGPPDYSRLKIPALAIYALESPDKPLPPWYDPTAEELKSVATEIARIRSAEQRSNIERFKNDVEFGQVREIPDATHYIIQSNQAEVLSAIEGFIERLGQHRSDE